MQILHTTTRIFIGLYGILTSAAAISDLKETGFSYYHVFYFIGTLLLLGASIMDRDIYVYISLVYMVMVAIITGVVTSTLSWQHILIRSIISMIIALVFIYSK